MKRRCGDIIILLGFGISVMLVAILLPACGRIQAGPPGATGEPGLQGPPGPIGSPGPATDLQVIKLCPAMPAATGFTEYLLRISGELFGVYSLGGYVYFTRLSPGNFVTTDGRPCNFTVNNNMEVVSQ